MEPFENLKSIITPLDKVNVDTDQIVPKQFLKLIQKTGFGKFLFYDWRYDDAGKPKSDFILNNPNYKNSKILITRDNFGCGSSREHAVWALKDYGFSVIIAPSFADIFYNNCFKNGILPIRLDSKIINEFFKSSFEIVVDLEKQTIKTPEKLISFEIEPHRKENLIDGSDDITITLQNVEKIIEYEKNSTVSSLL